VFLGWEEWAGTMPPFECEERGPVGMGETSKSSRQGDALQ